MITTLFVAITILIVGLISPFYILDALRLKRMRKTFGRKSFLDRLKRQLSRQVYQERKIVFWVCIASFILLFGLILGESYVHDSIYETSFNDMNLINKTLEEREAISENFASRFEDFFLMFKIYFFGALVLTVLIYFHWKFNRHLIIEEAISSKDLISLLDQLGVGKTDKMFYQTLEKNFGQSKKKEIYEALSDFIYDTLDYQRVRRIRK